MVQQAPCSLILVTAVALSGGSLVGQQMVEPMRFDDIVCRGGSFGLKYLADGGIVGIVVEVAQHQNLRMPADEEQAVGGTAQPTGCSQPAGLTLLGTARTGGKMYYKDIQRIAVEQLAADVQDVASWAMVAGCACYR